MEFESKWAALSKELEILEKPDEAAKEHKQAAKVRGIRSVLGGRSRPRQAQDSRPSLTGRNTQLQDQLACSLKRLATPQPQEQGSSSREAKGGREGAALSGGVSMPVSARAGGTQDEVAHPAVEMQVEAGKIKWPILSNLLRILKKPIEGRGSDSRKVIWAACCNCLAQAAVAGRGEIVAVLTALVCRVGKRRSARRKTACQLRRMTSRPGMTGPPRRPRSSPAGQQSPSKKQLTLPRSRRPSGSLRRLRPRVQAKESRYLVGLWLARTSLPSLGLTVLTERGGPVLRRMLPSLGQRRAALQRPTTASGVQSPRSRLSSRPEAPQLDQVTSSSRSGPGRPRQDRGLPLASQRPKPLRRIRFLAAPHQARKDPH